MSIGCVLPLYACIWNVTMINKDEENNYTKEGASLEPFGSELHLVHRLQHCTKGKKKVATPCWNK